MKKVLVAVALVVVLCFSFSAIAMAADSPGAGIVEVTGGQVKDVTKLPDDVVKETFKDIDKAKAPGDLVGGIDLNIEFDEPGGTASVKVVANVKKGDKIVIVSVLPDGTYEYIIPDEVGDGYIVFKAKDNGSTIFSYYMNKEQANNGGNDSGDGKGDNTSTSGNKSPKTADQDNMAIWFVLIAVAVGSGILVTRTVAKKMNS